MPHTDQHHPADNLNQALAIAHAWANRGVPAFPAAISWDPTKYDGAGGLDKRPLTEHGHLDATLDPDQLTHLYTTASLRPGEIIGTALHPGGADLTILDIDHKGTKNGYIAADNLGLRDTWGSSTPSGGEHRWFRRPPHLRIGNQSPWAQDGIDIRGDDGWIIAPGTITPWGNWAKLDQEWDDGNHVHAIPDLILGRLTHRPATTTGASTSTSSWQQLRPEHRQELHPATQQALDQLFTAGGHSPIIKREAGRDPWIEITRPGKRYGTSATCGRIGPGVVKIWTPNWAGLPEGIYETSPDGLHNTTQHEQALWDQWQATTTAFSPDTEPEPGGEGLGAYRVDWHELWTAPDSPEWLIEPVIAAGRGHALYAPAKAGKSLFITWLAAQAAQGLPALDQPPGTPLPVLYCDLEMTRDDLRERLTAMGHGPHSNLEHLHWLSLPPLILDTAHGAHTLTQYALEVGAQLVIVDTTARAVEGDENLADTYRAFARHTGISLKRAGIAFLRTDHAGKDIDKGQRGSSAKNDDVDIVWQLARKDQHALTLKATHRRMGWVPEQINLRQADDPLTYHNADLPTWAPGTATIAAWLDAQGAPLDISQRAATTLCKAENGGPGANQATLRDALKYRRQNQARALEKWVGDVGRAQPETGPRDQRPTPLATNATNSATGQTPRSAGTRPNATNSATNGPAERDHDSPYVVRESGREPTQPCTTCRQPEQTRYLDSDGNCLDCTDEPF